jgi:aspartyl/glutamyl-tRNA(Asn/Gln) amidotransferase C subunit
MSTEITKDLVAHIARLSMLKIDEKEIGEYQNHLKKVLKNIEELDSVNTEGVKPFANPMRECLHLFANHIDRRNDEVKPSLDVASVLKNAPDQKLNQFKIEAVIADE